MLTYNVPELFLQVSYCVGKKLAEKALWQFVEEEKPSFSVTNFMPPLIFGPMLQKVPNVEKINFSNNLIRGIMNSALAEGGKVPNTMFPGYVSQRLPLCGFDILCGLGAKREHKLIESHLRSTSAISRSSRFSP